MSTPNFIIHSHYGRQADCIIDNGMKRTAAEKEGPANTRIILLRLFTGLLGIIPLSAAAAPPTPIELGSAANFEVLAGSTLTSTGASVITGGNVGVSPGSAVTGFPPGVLAPPYTFHQGDATALQAQNDLTTAYNNAAGLPPTEVLTGQNLGGLILTPGVYSFSSSSQLTGTLTLDDEGNPDAAFIFQVGSTFTTAANSAVVTINGGASPGANVFWQIGSSATLGMDTAFEGNILADTSITLNPGASDLDGRLLARNGAVTLNDNLLVAPADSPVTFAAPETGSTFLLLGLAGAALLACRGIPRGKFQRVR